MNTKQELFYSNYEFYWEDNFSNKHFTYIDSNNKKVYLGHYGTENGARMRFLMYRLSLVLKGEYQDEK